MANGFWSKLKKPIFALAPMADVTDAAFRKIIAEYGKPDVMYTEFVSADGLCSPGRERLLLDLKYSKAERPIVAQFFGANPEHFTRVAELAGELGFDGIDINMGCPDRTIERQGGGAALMKNTKLTREIILATRRGAGNLPISIKTRIGYGKNELKTWLPCLLETEPAAIIIHARTRSEMSDVPARWETIKEAVEIRDRYDSSPDRALIIGNGDVATLADAETKIRESGADGAMIGRGIFGNPWLFNRKLSNPVALEKKLKVLFEHAVLFEKMFTGKKSFDVMKKHYKAYANGFPGAKELRMELMSTKNAAEALAIIERHFLNI
jgi:nifR3 family TIM-barrel protein